MWLHFVAYQDLDSPLTCVSLLFESHLNAECHGNAVNQLRIYEQSMQYSLKHLVINWVQGISDYHNDLQILMARTSHDFLFVCIFNICFYKINICFKILLLRPKYINNYKQKICRVCRRLPKQKVCKRLCFRLFHFIPFRSRNRIKS